MSPVKRKRANRNAAVACWGIFREVEHSPGRQEDDAAILEAAGRRLEEIGPEFSVDYRLPTSVTGREADLPALAFSMCEGHAAMEALRRWESRGVRVVNSPGSIANTHRERMMPLLDEARVPVPEGRLLDCGGPLPRGASHDALFSACWIKQATEHKTREGDVVFAADRSAVRDALASLGERGQPRAVVQRHVEGDHVKFYGVSPDAWDSERDAAPAPAWFEWFHPRERPVAGHGFEPRALCDIASRAARVLGLDVWGGDAIVTPAGEIYVIDVNAWPSFALYREAAADRIASHLAARLRRVTSMAV